MHRGIAGDLYLVLHIEEKQGIQRDGINLYSKVVIDYTEAILGTTKKVKALLNSAVSDYDIFHFQSFLSVTER